MNNRPYILTLSGLDPSNGAGMGADIKTIESLKCLAFSICTANTVQNDVKLQSCSWTALKLMKSQLKLLFSRFEINYVKIGIVKNWFILNELIDDILSHNPQSKIILDPILASSSTYKFHDLAHQKGPLNQCFEMILNKIYLLTPNYHEMQQLFVDKNITQNIKHVSENCHLLLKGGHRHFQKGLDELFLKHGKTHKLKPESTGVSEKHGSGCVLSSAICSYLALGHELVHACKLAKRYTETFLKSNTTLLGYHG